MTDFIILGTDTDVGKTTVSLYWLSLFSKQYTYWKPLETGPSDTEKIKEMVPGVKCFSPLHHFEQAIAPTLAARYQDITLPSAKQIVGHKPQGKLPLVIETFGSPFSPLNENELQIALVQEFQLPSVLVSSSEIGAIGRTLQCLISLAEKGTSPCAIILIGPADDYAMEQIQHHQGIPVYSLAFPAEWNAGGIRQAAQDQAETFHEIQELLGQQTMPQVETQFSVAELLKQDQQNLWHPYTPLRSQDLPLVATGAQDEFLNLADGRKVIDGISSWWTILHGHRNPVLVAALQKAIRQYDHILFAGVTHPPAIRLSDLLLGSVPLPGGRVFYSDNGSTAVEVALKMAYQYWCHHQEPQRTLFVGFENGYHGDTFGAMAASRDPVFFGTFEPLLFQTKIIPVCAEKLAHTLKENHGKVAAVIIEPLVQGAGGMQMHSPAELGAIAEVAQEQGVLFIVDEVMTGGGRLGPQWAHQEASIQPDLLCASKTLTGGMMPLAATLASKRIVQAFDTDDRRKTFFHGHSFTAHPLACSVAVANLEMMKDDPNNHSKTMEQFWKESLSSLKDHPKVKEVRIKGSIAAIELALKGGYLAEVGRLLRTQCLEEGVMLRPLGNVLYSMPPFCTTQASLEKIAGAMVKAINFME